MFRRFMPSRRDLLKSIKEDLDNNGNTPDRAVREAVTPFVFVFEYGEMMEGFAHSKVFEEPKICDAWSIERFYVWACKQGKNSFPVACKTGGFQTPRERIRGELYRIPSSHLRNIDTMRENGVKFKRKETRIFLPGQNPRLDKGVLVPAWIYIGVEEYWSKQIEWDLSFYRGREGSSFDIVSVQELSERKELKRFYHFSEQDLKERNPKCFIHTGPLTKDTPTAEQLIPKELQKEEVKTILSRSQREDQDLVKWNGSNVFQFRDESVEFVSAEPPKPFWPPFRREPDSTE